MKRIIYQITVITLITFLLLCSCAREETEPEGAIRIYCMDAAMTELKWEYYRPRSTDTEGLIAELIQRLTKNPSNDLYRKIKPDNVIIKNWYFGSDGQLILNFSSTYSGMDNITEVFCRAGIVKTLGQIDEVGYIEFYIEDEPLASKTGILAGLMSAEDFIDNTGEYVQFTTKTPIIVYFASSSTNLLEAEEFIVENDGKVPLEEIAMDLLFKGPQQQQDKLLPVIPADTVLNKISVHDGVCYLDLSREFVYGCESVSDELSVYAIVNTLVELPGITAVQLTVEEEPARMIGGFNLLEVLERRPELIGVENAVN